MPTDQEKVAFAKRLELALKRAPKPVKGPTQLANQFNLRHRGEAPISPQTAHKWLTGRTIPTADKITTLSDWLRVSEHWLHYGPAPTGAAASPDVPLGRGGQNKLAPNGKYPISPETLTLATKIERLEPHQRYLVEELITQFYGDTPPE